MEMVSVIVPVYNVEEYLDRCVASIVGQSYKNLEIILINDGSTDSSGSICEKWGAYDNVHVIKQENFGVSAARNEGIKQAKGEYIIFVDSDDWCDTVMVEKMVEAISECDFAYCAYHLDTDNNVREVKNAVDNGIYTVEEVYRSLFFGIKNTNGADMSTALWRGIFKTQIIRENNIKFDTYIRFAEDWIFYAEYFKYVKKVRVIDLSLYHYYQRRNSLTHMYIPASKLGVQKSYYILDRFLKLAKETQIDASLFEPYVAGRYVQLILRQANNIWNKQNNWTFREKKKFLLWAMHEVDIASKLETFQNTDLSRMARLMMWGIKHNSVLLLSTYGITYNTMRDLRDEIKQLKCRRRAK